jgi:hypothetical protein
MRNNLSGLRLSGIHERLVSLIWIHGTTADAMSVRTPSDVSVNSVTLDANKGGVIVLFTIHTGSLTGRTSSMLIPAGALATGEMG